MKVSGKSLSILGDGQERASCASSAERSKSGLALLGGFGFIGGWLHAVIGVSARFGVPMELLVSDSLKFALITALLVALALGGWLSAREEKTFRLSGSHWFAETAAVGISFAVASLGLRAALWVVGGG